MTAQGLLDALTYGFVLGVMVAKVIIVLAVPEEQLLIALAGSALTSILAYGGFIIVYHIAMRKIGNE